MKTLITTILTAIILTSSILTIFYIYTSYPNHIYKHQPNLQLHLSNIKSSNHTIINPTLIKSNYKDSLFYTISLHPKYAYISINYKDTITLTDFYHIHTIKNLLNELHQRNH